MATIKSGRWIITMNYNLFKTIIITLEFSVLVMGILFGLEKIKHVCGQANNPTITIEYVEK